MLNLFPGQQHHVRSIQIQEKGFWGGHNVERCGFEEWEEAGTGYREVERVGEGTLEDKEVVSEDMYEVEVEETVGAQTCICFVGWTELSESLKAFRDEIMMVSN